MNITAYAHTHIYTHYVTSYYMLLLVKYLLAKKFGVNNRQLRSSLGGLFYSLNHYTHAKILYVIEIAYAVTLAVATL